MKQHLKKLYRKGKSKVLEKLWHEFNGLPALIFNRFTVKSTNDYIWLSFVVFGNFGLSDFCGDFFNEFFIVHNFIGNILLNIDNLFVVELFNCIVITTNCIAVFFLLRCL